MIETLKGYLMNLKVSQKHECKASVKGMDSDNDEITK